MAVFGPDSSAEPVNPNDLGEIEIKADSSNPVDSKGSEEATGASGASGVSGAKGFCGKEQRISNKSCDSLYPAAAFDPAGNMGFVWSDTRDGNPEIYARFVESKLDKTVIETMAEASYDPVTGKLENLSCSGFSSQSNQKNDDAPVITAQEGELTVNAASKTMVLTIIGEDNFQTLGIVPGSIVTGLKGVNNGIKMTVARLLSPSLVELAFDAEVESDPGEGEGSDKLFSYSILRANAAISTPEVRLTCNRGASQFPDMVADREGRWHIVFQDDSTGNNELYYIMVHPKSVDEPTCTGLSAPITAVGFSPVPLGTPGSTTIIQSGSSGGAESTSESVEADPTSVVVFTGKKLISFPVTGAVGAFFAFGDKNLTDPEPIVDGPFENRTGKHRLFKDYVGGAGDWVGVSRAADKEIWMEQAIAAGIGAEPDYLVPIGQPEAGANDFGTKFDFTDVAFLAQTPPDKSVEITQIALSLKPKCAPQSNAGGVGTVFQNIQAAPKKPVPQGFIDPVNLSEVLTSPLVTIDENVPSRFVIEGDESGTIFTNILLDNGLGQLSRFVFSCDKTNVDKPIFILGQRHCGEELCALYKNIGTDVTANSLAAQQTGQYRIRLRVWEGPDYRFVEDQINSAQFQNAKLLVDKVFTFDPGASINVFQFKQKELVAADGKFVFFSASPLDDAKFIIEGVGGGHSVWSTNGDGNFDQYYMPFTVKPNSGLNVPVYYEGYLGNPTSGVKFYPPGTVLKKDCSGAPIVKSLLMERSAEVDIGYQKAEGSFGSGGTIVYPPDPNAVAAPDLSYLRPASVHLGFDSNVALFLSNPYVTANPPRTTVIIQPFRLDEDATIVHAQCYTTRNSNLHANNVSLDCIIIPKDDASIVLDGGTTYEVVAQGSLMLSELPGDPLVPATIKLCSKMKAGDYAAVFRLSTAADIRDDVLVYMRVAERLKTDPLPKGFMQSSLPDKAEFRAEDFFIAPTIYHVRIQTQTAYIVPSRYSFPDVSLHFSDQPPGFVVVTPDGKIVGSSSSIDDSETCPRQYDLSYGGTIPRLVVGITGWKDGVGDFNKFRIYNRPEVMPPNYNSFYAMPLVATRMVVEEQTVLKKVVMQMVCPKYIYNPLQTTAAVPSPLSEFVDAAPNRKIIVDIVAEKAKAQLVTVNGFPLSYDSIPDYENIIASVEVPLSDISTFGNTYNWSGVEGAFPTFGDFSPVEFVLDGDGETLEPGKYFVVVRSSDSVDVTPMMPANVFIQAVTAVTDNQRIEAGTFVVPSSIGTKKVLIKRFKPIAQNGTVLNPTDMSGFEVGMRLKINYAGTETIVIYSGPDAGGGITPPNVLTNPVDGVKYRIEREKATFETVITEISATALLIEPPAPSLPFPQQKAAAVGGAGPGGTNGYPVLKVPFTLDDGSCEIQVDGTRRLETSVLVADMMGTNGEPSINNDTWGSLYPVCDPPLSDADCPENIRLASYACFTAIVSEDEESVEDPEPEEIEPIEPADISTLIATVPIRITRSIGDSVHPRLAIDSHDVIWLAFHSNRSGADEVYIARNVCGKWFSSAQGGFDFRVTNAGSHGRSAQFPNIAVDELGEAHLVWHSTDTEDGKPDIFYAHSTNGGDGFTRPQRLTSSQGDALMPDIAIASTLSLASVGGNCKDVNKSTSTQSYGKIVVVWHDNRFGQFEIMSADRMAGKWYSSAYGTNDTRVTQAQEDSLFPRIASDSRGNFRTVYHDYRRGRDNPWIFMSTFLGSKGRWDSSGQGGTDMPITPTGAGASLHPDVAIDAADGVMTAWHDDRFSNSASNGGLPNEEIMSTYCSGPDAPAGFCGPICTNIEAFVQTTLDIVDPLSNTPIQATNIPEISLRINSPGATFYRVSEDGGEFSEWMPFKPSLDLDTLIANWTLGPGIGRKRICVQVQDAITVGFPVCKDIILRSGLPEFKIGLFKDRTMSSPLSMFGRYPVAPQGDIYIKITSSVPLVAPPTFDVISRGIRIAFNQQTMVLAAPGVSGFSGFSGSEGPQDPRSAIVKVDGLSTFSAAAGTDFVGRFTVHRDDGFFHIDGPARIIPHGKDIRGQSF